jgi:hypothetical protein
MTNGRRSALILGACLAAGALLFGMLWWWSAHRNAYGVASVDVATRGPSDSDALTPGGRALALRMRLLPDGGVSASPDSVRIGLASVSPDELAAYQAWLRGGGEGAGPRSFEELAAVTRWLNVPATLDADGAVAVAIADLPVVDRYVLQARADDGLRFYETSFTRENVPAELRPRVAAGLRLRAPRQAAGGAQVLFRRVEGSQDAQWQSLMRREAPTLLDAYDERALPVAAETVVAPMPPGPLDVIAVVDGVETERRRVTLSPGRLLTFDLDPEISGLGAAVSVAVALRLIEKGSRAPVKDAAVVWSSPRGERVLRTDASGMLRIEDIDPLQPLPIEIRFAPPKTPSFLVDVLPSWPERLPILLDLSREPVNAGVVAKTLELEPLRWLIVETPGIEIPRRPRVEDPFPVFVLQRRQGATWRESQADYFRPVPGGMAVSLNAPGTVRVAAVLAPWTVRISDAVDVGDATADVRFRTRIAAGSGRRVTLRLSAGNRSLAAAPVHVLSPLRGVPPKTLTADAAGRIVLDDVTEPSVLLEVPGYEQTRVPLDAATVSLTLRRDGE